MHIEIQPAGKLFDVVSIEKGADGRKVVLLASGKTMGDARRIGLLAAASRGWQLISTLPQPWAPPKRERRQERRLSRPNMIIA